MLSAEITNSLLWKEAFSNNEKNENVEKLKSSFINIREKVKDIVSLVIADFPDLTIHDISHLDKLWITADFLINKKFSLNPLETYVLGLSILLHDSALSFSAYKYGKEGIRNTIFWKDTFEELKRNSEKDLNELENLADFISIRKFHADQAKETVLSSWETVDKNLFFLIEDSDLRIALGELCGEIAASHHQDIEIVESKFRRIINSPAFLPSEWTIDPLKIAIILRCSDAAHISSDRAPNFLYALLQRKGVSFNHWQFQNRLSNPGYDDYESGLIFFNTMKAFSEIEQDSWWLAYDTLTILDKEIKNSNKILELNDRPQLFAQGVKFVDNPEKLSVFIKAEGWVPKNVSIHVSNIEKLITNFGGEKLYGSSEKGRVGIVLRELIQNSRDAIKAREHIDKYFESEYININFEQRNDDIYLTISDNGVGLSERVLFDVLLDFGNSFWSSNHLKDELPGLLSSGYKSIGKYGIGFYSVFMISDYVEIKTRNWNKGISETLELHFNDKNILRPTFKKNTNSLPINISTEISLRLKKNIFDDNIVSFTINPQQIGMSTYEVPPEAYISSITIGLDCDVYYNKLKIHENIEKEFDLKKLLLDASYTNYSPYTNKEQVDTFLQKNITRFRRIKLDGSTVGFVHYMYKSHDFLRNFNISTIGGLRFDMNRDSSSYSGLIGFVNGESTNLARNQNSNEKLHGELKKVFIEQLNCKEFDIENLSFEENNSFSRQLYNFGLDFWEHMKFVGYLNGNRFFLKITDISDIFISYDIGFAYLEGDISYGLHYFGQEENFALKNNILYILPIQLNEFVLLSDLMIDKLRESNPDISFEEIKDNIPIGKDLRSTLPIIARYLKKNNS